MTGAKPGTQDDVRREIAAEMRLRPDPPRVVRLSRRVLIAGAGLVALAIGALLIAALQTGEGTVREELYRIDSPARADELTDLPRITTKSPAIHRRRFRGSVPRCPAISVDPCCGCRRKAGR